MKFKTSFKKDETKGTEFSTIIKDYNLIETPTGEKKLIECGEHDIQEEINSYKDDCDINLLIAKYLNGDTNTGIGTPFTGSDITEIDNDLNSTYQKMEELKNNPVFDEFMKSDLKITNTNMFEKFNEFIKNKYDKMKETKAEEKEKEEVKA